MNVPKTAVIGATSYLGREFLAGYRKFHPGCTGTSKRENFEDLEYLDLRSSNIASLKLSETNHRHALILGAVSKLDDCENAPEETRAINVDGTLALVSQLREQGVLPIFTSSDVVFSGDMGGGYGDDASTSPLNEYGRQKALVEARMRKICGDDFLVIRLSKIFDLKKGGGTLLDEMAMKFSRGETVRAACDQIFSATLITDLIPAVFSLQSKEVRGIVNVCSDEAWSRFDMASALAEKMSVGPGLIEKIGINEIFSCVRPKNTGMTNERLKAETGCEFTPMKTCIAKTAENWNS